MRVSDKPRPKKQLGQNWLHDPSSIGRILEWAREQNCPGWLEIGCGPGTLTRDLLRLEKPFLGVELDPRMKSELDEEFSRYPQAELLMQDFLSLNPLDVQGKLPSGFGVIGNLPYYITAPILEHVLLHFKEFSVFGLMVQKEVGQRMLATPKGKEMSRLAVLVQSVCEASRLMIVKSGCFFPAPKVDSAFVILKRRESLDDAVLRTGLKLAKVGFASKRKMLRGLLLELYPKEKVDAGLESLGLSLQCRAEDLTPSDWMDLGQRLGA